MSRNWLVQIEIPVDGYDTPRDAAEAAWEGLIHDAPPVVSVHPADGTPDQAVTIDLSDDTTTGTDER